MTPHIEPFPFWYRQVGYITKHMLLTSATI